MWGTDPQAAYIAGKEAKERSPRGKNGKVPVPNQSCISRKKGSKTNNLLLPRKGIKRKHQNTTERQGRTGKQSGSAFLDGQEERDC